jgi:hypothetical protein
VGVTTVVLEGAPLCIRLADSAMLFYVLPVGHALLSPYVFAAASENNHSHSNGKGNSNGKGKGTGTDTLMHCVPLWGLTVRGLLQAFKTPSHSARAPSAQLTGSDGKSSSSNNKGNNSNGNSKGKSIVKASAKSKAGTGAAAVEYATQDKDVDFRDFSRALAM